MMQDKTYSVSEINKYIKDILEGDYELQNVQVQGEISNFKRYPSGHCYFSLKDAGGVLKCVLFRFKAMNLRFEPKNGDKVVAVGKIAVYERDGVYQLYTDLLLAQGAGDLMQQYEQLKEKLGKEGLFAEERKQKLPLNPQRLGIVTSPAGAAVRDIISVARRRNVGVKLYLYPVQVQGEGAAKEVAAAIKFFNERKLADVLIVGRGGGSIEDLWAFNEEVTVRAVAASKIPVISAVGHETDFTLCDFAADKRAATPSQAAEVAVPDISVYQQQVRNLKLRLRQAIAQNILTTQKKIERFVDSWALQNPRRLYELKEQKLLHLKNSWVFNEPLRLFAQKAQRLDMDFVQLVNLVQQRKQEAEHRLALNKAKLEAISPYAVFKRGYSCVRNGEKQLISSVEQVRWGEEIITSLSDGQIVSVVQEVERR